MLLHEKCKHYGAFGRKTAFWILILALLWLSQPYSGLWQRGRHCVDIDFQFPHLNKRNTGKSNMQLDVKPLTGGVSQCCESVNYRLIYMVNYR